MEKVRPGDPLEFSADTFNNFQRAGEMFGGENAVGGVQTPSDVGHRRITVKIKNDTGKLVPMYGVVGINGQANLPEQRRDEAARSWRTVTLSGVLPTTNEHKLGNIAITLERCQPGKIVDAVIYGITWARAPAHSSFQYPLAPEVNRVGYVVPTAGGTIRMITRYGGCWNVIGDNPYPVVDPEMTTPDSSAWSGSAVGIIYFLCRIGSGSSVLEKRILAKAARNFTKDDPWVHLFIEQTLSPRAEAGGEIVAYNPGMFAANVGSYVWVEWWEDLAAQVGTGAYLIFQAL